MYTYENIFVSKSLCLLFYVLILTVLSFLKKILEHFWVPRIIRLNSKFKTLFLTQNSQIPQNIVSDESIE